MKPGSIGIVTVAFLGTRVDLNCWLSAVVIFTFTSSHDPAIVRLTRDGLS